jgi:hypothetical protein
MWPTCSIIPTWWIHLMRVVLVTLLLFVSACGAPGHSRSSPSVDSADGGLRGHWPQGMVTVTMGCDSQEGTSILARRLTTILPAMTLAEASETTRIYRVAGRTGDRTALVTTRPCRAPHQTLSDAGLSGEGHVPMPGEVSLAHHGVLCLDERPEFRRHVLEVLCQPLENRIVTIARA